MIEIIIILIIVALSGWTSISLCIRWWKSTRYYWNENIYELSLLYVSGVVLTPVIFIGLIIIGFVFIEYYYILGR
jgi:hypothetical protein